MRSIICSPIILIALLFLGGASCLRAADAGLAKGDMNGDGVIDQKDFTLLISAALDPQEYCREHGLTMRQLLARADINNNGFVDLRDAEALKQLTQGVALEQPLWRSPLIRGDAAVFPLGVWMQEPRLADSYAQLGINLFVGLWQGPTEEQLARLARHGMPVICEQNAVGLKHLHNPLIYAWMYPDEPDNMQKAGEGQELLPPIPPLEVDAQIRRYKRSDPGRPVFLNLGMGVVWDGWPGRGPRTGRSEDYPEYYASADIASFDFYPFATARPEVHGQLWRLGNGIRRIIDWTAGEKPVWTFIETGRINNETAPTPAQVRSAVWMSIIHGARGLVYFVHRFNPTFHSHALLEDAQMSSTVYRINATVQSLAPVINRIEAREEPLRALAAPGERVVHYVRGKCAEYTYIFAVPMDSGVMTAGFPVPEAAAGAQAEVLEENRTIALQDGVLLDEFTGWSARLYRIPLREQGQNNGP